ncbi:helicase HerA-like domain-containing protein [Acetivibrio clariflavus]|uniref:Putative ATPase n=1 Tax=Acetivibrio clariflavus (strain DSM 19732 / NBRC 101661 / EBR45) TaxID=720554 RepID=G8LTY2_ACECE|nr:helicase HerA-like domain-containing protein [Acetivibrio clariflavus]AEV67328.1 putative ATPase [Acetivibrio clariflavus DSM 19732]
MYCDNKIWIAKGENPVYLLPDKANRHGLIAGATGTGKTVTLKVLAESFSDCGVPVFLADVKGDLAGLAVQGSEDPKIRERVAELGIEGFKYSAYPVRFWDIYGECGIPVRTTVSEMGALMLARLLGLNETQTGVLSIIFRIADDKGLLLIDMKDLRAMVQYVGEHAKEFTLEYGSISTQSVGAILRSLVALEDQGGNLFFGEPDLDVNDWIQTAPDGRGYINILHSVKLIHSPVLYSTFLLWMLSELFETLPEVGDADKPKIVFFFDEAHLLFKDAPKVLLQKIEQVVRLIRSKGVGIYFVTQNPSDLPDEILGQLGNRIQHALRAFTPSDQKYVKAAAQTFRANPKFNVESVISELSIGEALISCLDETGSPSIVERAFVLPPQSHIGTIDEAVRRQIILSCPMREKYAQMIDNESAYEILKDREKKQQLDTKLNNQGQKEQYNSARRVNSSSSAKRVSSGRKKTGKSFIEKAANSAANTIGREIGRTLIRGILGSLRK